VLTRHQSDGYGLRRRLLLHLAEVVFGVLRPHSGEAFKRCRDLTLTRRQGNSIPHSTIADAIDKLPGVRKLAIRNCPSWRGPLNRLLRRSHDTLE
jgi:hypothetical protein